MSREKPVCWFHLLAVSALILAFGAAAGAEPAAPAQAPAPAIDPQVQTPLMRACTLLSSARTLSYHAEIVFDSVLPSLVKLQYAGAMDVAIERPNRLAISYQSDLGAKKIWYDEDKLTIYDPAHLAYAAAPAPDSIDGMIAAVAKSKNLTIPLAGFDVSDPCQRAVHEVLHSKYVGLNDVSGIACDHLAFDLEKVDWQLWIEHGAHPVPRKVVITYKELPTQPQWSAVFSQWRFNQPIKASTFAPKLPAKAIKAEFIEFKEQQQ